MADRTLTGWHQPLGHGGYMVGRRRVTRAQFKRAINHQRNGALQRSRTVRGRKRAILHAFPLQGCDHEFSYREDWSGDPGVINGTFTISWVECEFCGAKREARDEDIPTYDDF